jgi:hypothetical protein
MATKKPVLKPKDITREEFMGTLKKVLRKKPAK